MMMDFTGKTEEEIVNYLAAKQIPEGEVDNDQKMNAIIVELLQMPNNPSPSVSTPIVEIVTHDIPLIDQKKIYNY